VNTGQKLWHDIKEIETGAVMTDYWKPYQDFVPKEKHIQSKKETYTVEGYNSICRHFLARLKRKTKCYSKSVEMLAYSLHLLMLKWNSKLDILG
jgi:insertion element IS1 protein InsB